MVVVLRPSEYQGEPDTAVGGRVVLSRIMNLADGGNAESTGTKGKKRDAQGKGKAGNPKGKNTDNYKCEVHLLGGDGMQEMLFVEAWGQGAQILSELATGVVQIRNAKIVPSRPKYSTSKLAYFVRAQNPIGTATQIEQLNTEPWVSIPKHHPFVDVSAMRKVPEDLQCCVLAMVSHQPGVVQRTSQYGESVVCNPILRVKDTTIRASFWRQAAERIAEFEQGSIVALYQVTVKKIGSGVNSEWELRASRSTRIEECPAELREDVQASTDLNTEATQSLTRDQRTDYDRVQATPCNVGSLAALLMPGFARELSGVYEIHSANALGIQAVLTSGSFSMTCCGRCKRQVPEGALACSKPEHATEPLVERWIAKVSFSDDTGTAEAIVYHDALVGTELFPGGDARQLTDAETVLVLRKLRQVPWSMRLVYNRNETRQENTLEAKLMLPTVTADGLLASWAAVPLLPEMYVGLTCPFAACADVVFDKDLGVTNVNDQEATSVRLLVRVLNELEDEDTAQPDTSAGLRVTRRIKCAVKVDDDSVYRLSVAGLSSGVQWLLRAKGDSVWMVLASKRGVGDEFVSMANLEVTKYPSAPFNKYVLDTYNQARGPGLFPVTTDTPLKRRKMLDDRMPPIDERSVTFSTRTAWADVAHAASL